MLLDTAGYLSTVDHAGATAAEAEAAGYDGWWVSETHFDPFLGCAVAAERTTSIQLGTSIAVALARSPMTVATMANDLHQLSGGRFVLGLGSQIKAHIERRYSMPWSRPAARMREFVLAVRAIWDAFETGEPPTFDGEFYTHSLLPPFFNPGPNPHGRPPIMLAGVGPLMTEVAGEVADGFLCHAFTTERYLREVTLPALERGRAKAGLPLDGLQISGPGFLVASDDEAVRAAAVAFVRQQIGFYASTPAYRPVLELHGWGHLQPELTALTKAGRWEDLAACIDDEVLDAFAVVGTSEQAVAEVGRRYGDVVTRLPLPVMFGQDAAGWRSHFSALRSIGAHATARDSS